MRNAPAMHGNDHISGGPDPIPGSIGSSWLTATADFVGPNASGITPVAIPLVLYNSAGADVSIDGGDPTKIDVATTGLYQVGLSNYPIGIDVGTVTSIVGYVGIVTNDIPGGTGVLSFTHTVEEALGNGIFVGTTWLMFVYAGGWIQVNVAVTTDDASTWAAGAGSNESFAVFRMA